MTFNNSFKSGSKILKLSPTLIKLRPILRMMDTTIKYNDQFEEGGDTSDIVSLRIGAPGKRLLTKCVATMKDATCKRLDEEEENGYIFQYGVSFGDWNFRKNLAEFLSTHYKETVSLGNLMATGGASFGLYLAASLYFGRGRSVFVEDPTYFIALKVFKDDLNMNIIPVPLDSEGININILEEKLKETTKINQKNLHGVKSKYDAMVYLIPGFQNPTGICYSPKRCKQLVDLAHEYNLLILCDDVYNLLHYESEQPPKPLVLYEKNDDANNRGHVISNGSFSKIFAPGMRMGWIHASKQILVDFHNSGLIDSGGNFQYMSGIMSKVLENGYQGEHLSCAKEIYKRRMEILTEILQKNLPDGCTFTNPGGGYFMWIVLPLHISAMGFNDWLMENYKILIHPGNRCSAVGNFANCFRISVAYHEDEILIDAVNRLCKGLKIYIENHKPDNA